MFIARWAIGIARVIHTGTEVWIVEILILMVKPKVMRNFLAHDKPPPGRSVVSGSVKIRIIHLGNGLSDMYTTSNPYLRDTKPAVVAVSGITGLDSPAGRTTILWPRSASDFRQIQNVRLTPVSDRLVEIRIPG